jgi:membrane protein
MMLAQLVHMSKLRSFIADLYNTVKAWSDDSISLHSSSLAYCTVFSIAPLLIIAIAIAGSILGKQASQGLIFGEVQGLIGGGGAEAVQNMVQNAASKPHSGVLATLLSVITLVIGATAVFQQLQQSLNMIWKVQAPVVRPAKAGVFSRKLILPRQKSGAL